MRRLITSLIRLSELPPWLLVVTTALGIGLAYVNRELSTSIGEPLAGRLSLLGFALALVPLLPMAVRDLNIWRLFPPRYHGINRALDRISDGISKRNCLYIGEDDRVRIDALRVVEQYDALIRNLDFVGTDKTLQERAGAMNAEAFSGTRYGLSAQNKRDRNASLSSANPVSFALLRDGEGGHNGLAATLPLAEDVATRYALGQISDNDMTGALLARPGEAVGAVVFFLIAHCRTAGERRASLLPDTLAMLVEACLLQLVLIAVASRGQKRFFTVAANSDRKMQELFQRLHLLPRPDHGNADREAVFGNYVMVRQVAEARRHLKRNHPDLAAQLRL